MTAALLVFGIFVATAPQARAAGTRLVVDASFEHADYAAGEADTLTTTIAWRTSRWSLSLGVPYVSKDLPVLLRLGGISVPAGPGAGMPREGPGGAPGEPPGQGPNDDPGGQGPNDDPGGNGGGGNGSDGGGGGGSDGGSGGEGGNGGDGGNTGNGGDGGNGGSGGDGGSGGNGGNGGDGGNGDPGNGSGGSRIAGGAPVGEAGDGAGGDPRPATADTTETDGLGDPVLRLTFALPGTLPGGGHLGLFAAAKVPLADETLGTEEWDLGAGLLFWRTGLLTDVYLEMGYWALGDPATVDLDDPFTWEAYLTRRLPSGRWAFATLTRGAAEIYDGAGSTAEVGAWAGWVLPSDGTGDRALTQSLGLTVTAGIGDAAPDWRAILSWRLGIQGPRLLLGAEDR